MDPTAMRALSVQDLLRPPLLADPSPFYAALLQFEPVHWDPVRDAWVISRYDDVMSALAHPHLSAARLARDAPSGVSAEAVLSRQLLYLDPPAHTRMRTLVNRGLAPSLCAALRPRIRAVVTELLDAMQAAGRADFVRSFASPLPIIVVTELIGVPPEDRDRIRDWSACLGLLLAGIPLDAPQEDAAHQGIRVAVEYFRDLLRERTRRPRHDLVSALAVGGAGAMDRDDIAANLLLLVAAGHGTTTHLLGNGVSVLLDHPEQWQRLVHHPDLVPLAADELLRYECPVRATGRVALSDLEVGGHAIASGQRVITLLAAANRDATRFTAPDTLDVARGPRHLAFGAGIHRCPGATLARLEIQIAFAEVVRRFPTLRRAGESPQWIPNVTFRGHASLPVTF